MKKYERFDSCYATIIDKCSKGVFLMLDNNEFAYARDFTSHRIGARVLCSVLKEASGAYRTLVSIDSTCYDRELAS